MLHEVSIVPNSGSNIHGNVIIQEGANSETLCKI